MLVTRRRYFSARWVLVIAAAVMASAAGCGSGNHKTYPVTGTIELVSGDVSQLAGSHIEAALENEPNLRATGEVQSDGSFTLETLDGGKIRKGALQGSYLVRILPDDYKNTAASKNAIAPSFQRFETSGLSFQVPAKGKVTLRIAP